jgi:hypothetical protein
MSPEVTAAVMLCIATGILVGVFALLILVVNILGEIHNLLVDTLDKDTVSEEKKEQSDE